MSPARSFPIFFLLLLFGAGTARAADDKGDYVVKGVGSVACSSFVAAAERGGAEALGEYGGYVAGYTSAFNEMSPGMFDAWGWQTLDTAMLFLLQRCRQNPAQTFGAALTELTRYYATTGIASREDMRLVGTEDKGFYLYESTYQALLAALGREGYPIDDPYASLMKYKQDKSVLSSANVHQILLLRLIGPAPR